jgi:hypothetical protein
MQANGISKRVQLLEEHLQYPLPRHLQQEYEALDQFRIQAGTYAECRCRKLKMGQVAFSPEIAKARTLIQAWLLAKGLKVSSRLLQHTMKKAELSPSHRHLSLALISTNLKSAYTSYYGIKSDHTPSKRLTSGSSRSYGTRR